MYLKEIKLVGFKSFAEKTSIEFKNGIIGVVGPNGSGKSNIVDAVRWVLGEQSVKSLRGDGAMTDVIFSGSKSRKPLNRASVTLILDNSDKYFPIDYTELSIKRSIYHDGDNEYFLNGEKCRLKDITDLLLDTRLSRESFNIISQGEVEKILSNKPEERRIIFEEASGVLKYKKRKETALRKLDRTNDNLHRVTDIMNELEPQLEPLKEQSAKAREYVKAKEELESVELALITGDIDNINYDYKVSKDNIEKLNKEIISLGTNYSGNEGEIEKLKLELHKVEDQIQKKQTELVEISTVVEKLNSQKKIATERQKYNIDDSKIHDTVVKLKEDELQTKNNISLLKKEIEEQRLELLKELKVIKDIETNILKIKEKKNHIIEEYNNLTKNITELNYKINIIEKSIDNNGSLYKGVKSVLANPRLIGIHGIIGKLIEVEEKYALSIETSLGGSMQFIITNNEKNAKEAINYLKDSHMGKATFFPLNIITPKAVDPNILSKIKDDESFVGIGSDLVKYKSKYRNVILNQLGNVIICNNIDGANKISKKINHRYKIVTLDGELIHIGGSLTGGRNRANQNGMIKEKYELEKLNKDVNQFVNTRKELETQIKQFDYNSKELESKLYSKQTDKIKLEENIDNKINNLDNLIIKEEEINIELKGLKNVLSDSVEEAELKIMDKYYKYSKNKDELNQLLERLIKNKTNVQSDIEEKELDIRKSNSIYNKTQNELKDLEIKVTRMEIKLDSLLEVLSEDYSITFEKAKEKYKLEISEKEARSIVKKLKTTIKELGMINMVSIDEYERINKRYTFLENQKEDLNNAENTLMDIIKEMDIIMKEKFIETFKSIQIEFKKVFKDLFGGGNAELKLTDPENVLETGIDIIAQPPGKQLQYLSLLSGGEKTLTAITLLFSILNAKPVPFCILDEVEAALDEANIINFGEYLQNYKDKTQFIMITHQKKTMEYSDILYGITMQESGVSKLVSVKLEEVSKYTK